MKELTPRGLWRLSLVSALMGLNAGVVMLGITVLDPGLSTPQTVLVGVVDTFMFGAFPGYLALKELEGGL